MRVSCEQPPKAAYAKIKWQFTRWIPSSAITNQHLYYSTYVHTGIPGQCLNANTHGGKLLLMLPGINLIEYYLPGHGYSLYVLRQAAPPSRIRCAVPITFLEHSHPPLACQTLMTCLQAAAENERIGSLHPYARWVSLTRRCWIWRRHLSWTPCRVSAASYRIKDILHLHTYLICRSKRRRLFISFLLRYGVFQAVAATYYAYLPRVSAPAERILVINYGVLCILPAKPPEPADRPKLRH